MKIHPAQQGSLEWMCARAGVATASEFGALLTPEFKIRTGEMPKTYLAQKVAERWTNSPLPGFNSFDMDQGHLLESEAVPWYEIETGEKVQRVGLCTTDDGRIGCSPDGLIGDDCGLEVKCPAQHTHVRYLLAGQLPKDYAAQVHGAMFVTGRPRWRFLSYCRGYPPLILTVERDEEIQATIQEALAMFILQMNDALAALEKLNGGPPKRRLNAAPPPPTPEPFDDIIP